MRITKWEYDLRHEVSRVLWTCNQMSSGFYRDKNMLVLPCNLKTNISVPVLLPDLDYQSIAHFWDKISHLDRKPLYVRGDEKLENEILKLLESVGISKPKYMEVKKMWEEAEEEILKTIYELAPMLSDGLEQIVIYPTRIGTRSTFEVPKSFPGKMQMFLREGESIHTIVEGIVTALIKPGVTSNLKGKWFDSELIVDWLIVHSKLAKVIEKYEPDVKYSPTVHITSNTQYGDLIISSREFYRKLGLQERDKLDKLLEIKTLTYSEKKLLRLLIVHDGEITSFDDVGDILFDDPNKFSMYAMSKTIERIRKKISKAGFSHTVLQTVRGRGYLLDK